MPKNSWRKKSISLRIGHLSLFLTVLQRFLSFWNGAHSDFSRSIIRFFRLLYHWSLSKWHWAKTCPTRYFFHYQKSKSRTNVSTRPVDCQLQLERILFCIRWPFSHARQKTRQNLAPKSLNETFLVHKFQASVSHYVCFQTLFSPSPAINSSKILFSVS